MTKVIDCALPGTGMGTSNQIDAQTQFVACDKVTSTDPPYYDNVGYADLSDFFYAWLRRTLKAVFPQLFGTLAVPKSDELVATPYRHGSKHAAEDFFLQGMTRALRRLAAQVHPGFPVTVYYAFKQSETKRGTGTASTGWETFLDAVISSGLAITGTWPMRTELPNRMIGRGTNALASSIVLVCRRRPADAPLATRREFLTALRRELPNALQPLQAANIAPVDLAQAAIGPGMAVYTRHGKVLVIVIVVHRIACPPAPYLTGSTTSRNGNRWNPVSRVQIRLTPCSRMRTAVWRSHIWMPRTSGSSATVCASTAAWRRVGGSRAIPGDPRRAAMKPRASVGLHGYRRTRQRVLARRNS